MAISDPVPSVPTPTGALQGVALFSWSGSAWTPSGVPAPSVATPTGVLRGCAGFSWDGSAWQPAGRAQPSVPTPNGTLDGVALYNWNGSSWQPASGKPSVPTPSGTLEGVAVFNFDGTSWQPTGQAAPEIATPYGTLKGVAAFSWNGAAWAAFPQPSLDLQFASVSAAFVGGPLLPSSVSFTRASIAGTATYFDATGTLRNAPYNLLTYSTDFTNAAWALFNSATKGATFTGPDGSVGSAMTLNFAANASSQMFQNATITAGMVFSVWARANTANSFVIRYSTDGNSPTFNLTSQWQRFSFACVGTNANVGITNGTSNAGSIDIWGPQLEAAGTGAPNYYVPTGAAATGGPRLDYDPVAHTPRGLLIEESRVNAIFPSIPDGTWSAGAAVVTTNSTTAPDGTNTATLVVDNVTNTGHNLNSTQAISFVSGTTYTFSVFAKQASARYLQLYTGAAAFTNSYANFDLQAGAITGSAGCTPTIQSVGNGWYRCIMVAACNTSASAAAFAQCLTGGVSNPSRSPGYAGTGTGVYVWGAMSETGAFPTSYIPTTGAAVTRAAEFANLTWPGTVFTTGNGSLAYEYSYPQAATVNLFHWSLEDVGTGANQLAIYQNTGGVNPAIINKTGGTTRWNANLGSVSPGVIAKEAVAWNATNVFTQEGANANSNANPAAPASYNTLLLGRQNSGNIMNGYTRRVRYWPQALTAAQLAQVCT